MTCPRCAKEFDADSAFCRFCGTRVTTEAPRTLSRYPDAGRIAGVCAGIAAYFETDVTLVRLLWVVLSIYPGAVVGGLLFYVVAWIVVPSEAAPRRFESAPSTSF